ncbi:TniQ family protein [Paenirhodobacter sp.]|uniref:TniQ family protein n=1 Tax=Paenirhodobacter sp. TaxID=1965326 RepID=UPI003B3DA367
MTLALTLPVSPLEMPTSYLSRLAARNLAPDLWTFCQDVGLDFAAISNGDGVAIAHLCTLACIPADSFQNRTAVKTSTMKYAVGAEVMNTETLARGEIRYCPSCVAEALRDGPRLCDVIHELHWQFIQVRRCWRHTALLQRHRPKIDASSRFDFTAFVRVARQEITRESKAASAPADDLDLYLTRRAYGDHAAHWCNCLEIPALIKASTAFGVLIDHGRDMRASSLDPDQRRDAMLTGFAILSAGPDGIRQALDRFNKRTPTRGGNQPHPSNGELQRLLGSHARQRADLDPLRDIVREYFHEHYPFWPGTTVLGRKIGEKPGAVAARRLSRNWRPPVAGRGYPDPARTRLSGWRGAVPTGNYPDPGTRRRDRPRKAPLSRPEPDCRDLGLQLWHVQAAETRRHIAARGRDRPMDAQGFPSRHVALLSRQAEHRSCTRGRSRTASVHARVGDPEGLCRWNLQHD